MSRGLSKPRSGFAAFGLSNRGREGLGTGWVAKNVGRGREGGDEVGVMSLCRPLPQRQLREGPPDRAQENMQVASASAAAFAQVALAMSHDVFDPILCCRQKLPGANFVGPLGQRQ